MPDAEPERTPTRRERYRLGVRIGLGLAAGSFLLAVAFGAMTRAQGWGLLAPIVCSLAVFSGSAQFALATGLAGGSVATALGAAALINARFLPMGLAVAPALRGGRLRRAAESQAVVDGSWAAAHLGGGRFDRELLIGATAVQWPAWAAGTALGVLAAPPPDLIQSLGLDVVFPAFFLVLLVDELRGSRRARLAAGIAAALAAGIVMVAPVGVALIASGAGALIGLRRPHRRAP